MVKLLELFVVMLPTDKPVRMAQKLIADTMMGIQKLHQVGVVLLKLRLFHQADLRAQFARRHRMAIQELVEIMQFVLVAVR